MKPENYDDIEEIDLVEVFYAVLARWSVILLATVVLATLGYCYGRFFVTPQYASTSALYVLSKSTSITSMATASPVSQAITSANSLTSPSTASLVSALRHL